MFYRPTRCLTFILILFMLGATYTNARKIRVQNRTFYSLFATCDNIVKKRKKSQKINWMEIKHNSTRSFKTCQGPVSIARSRHTKSVRPFHVYGSCTKCVNLHSHILQAPHFNDLDYTLNGFPTSLYVCSDEIT